MKTRTVYVKKKSSFFNKYLLKSILVSAAGVIVGIFVLPFVTPLMGGTTTTDTITP